MAISKPPKCFWPLVITAGANNKIDFTVSATPYVASVTAGTYYSAAELCLAVDTALTAARAGQWTVTASATGRVTITYPSAFSLEFGTGPNVAASIAAVLGFRTSDYVAATTQAGDRQHQSGWYPERPVVFDSREEYERHAAGTTSLSGATKSLVFGSARESRRIAFDWLPEWKTKIAREGDYTNEALERLWRDGYARFRWWPDAATEGTYVDLVLDSRELGAFAPGRDPSMQLYSYTIKARKYV